MKKSLFLLLGIPALTSIVYGETMLVYHEGKVDAFFTSEVENISFSKTALDGNPSSAIDIQEIRTPDSIYRYDVSKVDSIIFRSPETVAKENAMDIAENLHTYVLSDDYSDGIKLFLSLNMPTHLLPEKDSYLYQLEPSESLRNGFAAKVTDVVKGEEAYMVTCSPAEPDEIFERLVWEGKSTCISNDGSRSQENPGMGRDANRIVHLPTFVSNMKYPDIISGSISMDDNLRDIPAGPAQPEIKAEIKINPSIECEYGVYVLPDDNDKITNIRRFRTTMKSNVSGTVSGRRAIDGLNVVSSHDNTSISLPLGLGYACKLTYTGNMRLKGTMGLEYSFDSDYSSSASTQVKYDTEEVTDASFNYTQEYLENPIKKLDASMSGEVSVSGSLSFTITQNSDSLKSIGNVFTYGSKLEGDALFRTSETAKAATDYSLYKKITAGGVKSIDISSVTGSYKYESNTTKFKLKNPQYLPVVFYAVPKLTDVRWNQSTKTISYDMEGTPMEFSSSRLGVGIKQKDSSQFSWHSSNYTWPENCTDSFGMKIEYNPGNKQKLYPTVTLPSGERILALPEYPAEYNLFPVNTCLNKDGVRVLSGATMFGSGSNGTSAVNSGNIFP